MYPIFPFTIRVISSLPDKKVLKALEVDDRSMPPRQVLGLISNHKNRCTTPEELEGRVSNYFEQQLHKIYKTYQKMLREQQSMDFDDLLSNTVYLFRDNKEVSARYQSCFDYILLTNTRIPMPRSLSY